MKKEYVIAIQGALAAAGAFLSDRLGVLFPVLCLLACAMVADYVSGMLASKRESLDHPGDPAYGWSSARGAKGIIKKVSYLCVIAVAMMVDYVIAVAAGYLDIVMPVTAFFGLLVAVWYLLNELLCYYVMIRYHCISYCQCRKASMWAASLILNRDGSIHTGKYVAAIR